MKTKLLILGLSLLVAATFFGCGTRSENLPDETSQSISTTKDSDSAYTEAEPDVTSVAENEIHSSASTDSFTEPETELFTKAEADTAPSYAPANTTATDGDSQTEYEEPQINFSDLE